MSGASSWSILGSQSAEGVLSNTGSEPSLSCAYGSRLNELAAMCTGQGLNFPELKLFPPTPPSFRAGGLHDGVGEYCLVSMMVWANTASEGFAG